MCNGLVQRFPTLPRMHTVSPLSPTSPSSLTGFGRTRKSPATSGIPQILFIPTEFSLEKAVSPPHPPTRVDDEPKPESSWDSLPQDNSSGRSSRLPRIPRRQESIDYDPNELLDDCQDESKESSPRLPRRKVSITDFEEWLQDGADSDFQNEEDTDEIHPPEGRRHSFPVRGLPNHFQYIVDPDAGGSCPKLPRRCKSIRKLVQAVEACKIRGSPRMRTKSGHL